MNNEGLVSKRTKQVANQVDSDLLARKDLINEMLDEERENM